MKLSHVVARPAGPGPFPTLVALHGYGGEAAGMLALGQRATADDVLVVCPQGPLPAEGGYGHGWYRVVPEVPRDWDEFERVATAVRQFIDEALQRYGGDPRRVAVLGFSAGGRLAYRIGLGWPDRFAAVAALSTTLADEIVARLDGARIAEAGPPDVLVQHGAFDVAAPIERGRAARRGLRALGIEPEYHEYPMAHETSPGSERDLARWLRRTLRLEPAENSV